MTRRTLTLKDAREIVRLVENQLGWVAYPRRNTPPSKVREQEVRKLVGAAEEDDRFTRENLEAAIWYLQRQQRRIGAPSKLPYWVDKALADVEPVEATPIGDRIDAAVAMEQQAQHPGWEQWTSRLVRATGEFRVLVLEEWLNERGHLWKA